MIADLEVLLLREWDAADRLEHRLLAVERRLAAGDVDDGALEVDLADVRVAADRCASLALLRALVTHAATGTADTNVGAIVDGDGARQALQELRAAVERVNRRRDDLERSLPADPPRRSDLGPPLHA